MLGACASSSSVAARLYFVSDYLAARGNWLSSYGAARGYWLSSYSAARSAGLLSIMHTCDHDVVGHVRRDATQYYWVAGPPTSQTVDIVLRVESLDAHHPGNGIFKIRVRVVCIYDFIRPLLVFKVMAINGSIVALHFKQVGTSGTTL